MRRLFFRGEHRFRAAELFFGGREDFRVEDYAPYLELEAVLQDDGRFSVWGNLPGDAVLLRDTRPDWHGVLHTALHMADEVVRDDA